MEWEVGWKRPEEEEHCHDGHQGETTSHSLPPGVSSAEGREVARPVEGSRVDPARALFTGETCEFEHGRET